MHKKTKSTKQKEHVLDKLHREHFPTIIKALKTSKKALVRLPTGTGKTIFAANVIQHFQKSNKKFKVLWITHRNELVEQSRDRLSWRLGIASNEIALFNSQSKNCNTKCTIMVASIPILTKPKNLKKFRKQHFDLIVVDEAHHAPAETWSRILHYFKGMRLGLTATPFRPDSLPLDFFFGEPLIDLSFEQAQEKGYIAKDESWIVLTNSVIYGAPSANGEYKAKDLGRLFESSDRNQIIIKAYKKYGQGTLTKLKYKPKTVCYCISIEHAKRMQTLFNDHGSKAEILVSNRKYQKVVARKKIFETFRDTNDIEILCVVDIFNEGIDIPDINCAIMARPTGSAIVYCQQIGRVARRIQGKDKFVLLDFVDNVKKEYGSYISANLKGKPPMPEKITTEYLKMKDPVILEDKVKYLMSSVKRFEEKLKLNTRWDTTLALAAARKCLSRKEFKDEFKTAYEFLWRNKQLHLLDDIHPHSKSYTPAKFNWNSRTIREKFLECDRSYTQLREKYPSAAIAAGKRYKKLHKWMLGRPSYNWPQIKKLALITQKKKLLRTSIPKSVFRWLQDNPKYKSEFDKIIPSSRPALTKERVLEIAKSCKSYAEFRNHRGCLKWAKKNNFLRELKKVLPPKTLIQASIPQRIKIMKKVAAICKKTGLSQAKVLDQLNIEKSKFCKWKLAHKKLAKRLGLRPRR